MVAFGVSVFFNMQKPRIDFTIHAEQLSGTRLIVYGNERHIFKLYVQLPDDFLRVNRLVFPKPYERRYGDYKKCS